MRHFFQYAALFCICAGAISACDTSLSPATPAPTISASSENNGLDTQRFEAFQAEFQQEGKTYQGAIRMLFIALLELETSPATAEVMLSAVYNGKKIYADSDSPTGFSLGNSDRFLLEQMQQRPEIVRSYLGGTPDKNYENFDPKAQNITYPAQGTVIEGLRVNNTIDGNTEGQVYIQSQGKDFPTPIRLEKNNQGLFKIDPSSVSSIATGVKQAEPENF